MRRSQSSIHHHDDRGSSHAHGKLWGLSECVVVVQLLVLLRLENIYPSPKPRSLRHRRPAKGSPRQTPSLADVPRARVIAAIPLPLQQSHHNPSISNQAIMTSETRWGLAPSTKATRPCRLRPFANNNNFSSGRPLALHYADEEILSSRSPLPLASMIPFLVTETPMPYHHLVVDHIMTSLALI